MRSGLWRAAVQEGIKIEATVQGNMLWVALPRSLPSPNGVPESRHEEPPVDRGFSLGRLV